LTAAGRKRLRLAFQAAFVAAVLWFAGAALARQWSGVRESLRAVHPAWGPIAASVALVYLAYALLIQTWRAMLHSWGARLRFVQASRIWFVSNLGRYVPGKVWQIAAMGVMAQGQGVSPIAATGSSLVVNVANVISGFAVVFATGAAALEVAARGGARTGAVVAAALAVVLLALPAVWPLIARVAVRASRGRLVLPAIPARSIWLAGLGTAAAWILYGLAFQLLARGLDLGATGATRSYLAVYASSYLVGYLTLLAPGGIGVREAMMVVGLTRLGVMPQPDAWLLAIVSRLWLTVMEIVPGLVFLLLYGTRRRGTS
jgi:uncharacterized membrane protein YbhN (UPF0104 family)